MSRIITHEQFIEVGGRRGYYAYGNRWKCASAALSMIGAISESTRVLEVGPYKIPLIKDSDVLDVKKCKIARPINQVILHDAGMTPWPIMSGSYDLVIALQVWEHLKGNQRAAFDEVMRIATRAVLSFPLEWQNKDDDDDHTGISMEKILSWTGIKPKKTETVQIDTKRTCVVCLYE